MLSSTRQNNRLVIDNNRVIPYICLRWRWENYRYRLTLWSRRQRSISCTIFCFIFSLPQKLHPIKYATLSIIGICRSQSIWTFGQNDTSLWIFWSQIFYSPKNKSQSTILQIHRFPEKDLFTPSYNTLLQSLREWMPRVESVHYRPIWVSVISWPDYNIRPRYNIFMNIRG